LCMLVGISRARWTPSAAGNKIGNASSSFKSTLLLPRSRQYERRTAK
jgi:hypothetical protein